MGGAVGVDGYVCGGRGRGVGEGEGVAQGQYSAC